MAAKKAASKATSAAASIAAEAPTGRWAQVLTETRAKGKAIEPFEITKTLVLSPPTPARSRAMSRATMAAQAAVKASVNAVTNGAGQDEVNAIRDAIEAADDMYTRALVGEDNYDAVVAYFEVRGEWEREAFYDALKQQFLRLPGDEELDRNEQLEDHLTAVLEALSKVDPENPLIAEIAGELPGKGNGSSTTSETTGTNSNPTSPDTSPESEPETGASSGPGVSSSTTPKRSRG